MSDDMQARWQRTTRQGVRDVAKQAASRIHGRYESSLSMELDDLFQEALINLVTVPTLVELLAVEGEVELGLLQHRLEQVLTWKHCRREVRESRMTVPYSRIDGESFEESAVVTFNPAPPLASDYSREQVEMLLPAIWDETYTYGLPKQDTAPDPDMPRGSSNPKTGNNLPAYIADIKTGWAKAPLTQRERRATLMRFGLSMTQDEIADHEGISQQAISARLFSAVGKIVARLNAGIWYELEGVEA